MHTPLYDIPFLESYLCNERGALRLRQAFLEVFRAFFRLGRVVPAFGIVIVIHECPVPRERGLRRAGLQRGDKCCMTREHILGTSINERHSLAVASVKQFGLF
jgi:hypothetical protein